MTVEFARFTARPGEDEKLIAERPSMLAALRARFPGCLAAYLTREPDGTFVDVLVWRTPEDAAASAQEIMSIPECAAWLAHIAESDGIRHAELVDAWPAL